MNLELIEKLAHQIQVTATEMKKSLGYHSPADCSNPFGCGKCKHGLTTWGELSENEKEGLRYKARGILVLLGAIGYEAVPKVEENDSTPSDCAMACEREGYR